MTAIDNHGRVSNEAEQELDVRTALEAISEEADPDSPSGPHLPQEGCERNENDSQLCLAHRLGATGFQGDRLGIWLGSAGAVSAEGLNRSRGNWWQEEGFRE